MVKVGLIFPRFRYKCGDIPLGISYLASSLKKETNAYIKIIDTTFLKNIAILKKILSKERFDIIGISVMTSMLSDVKKVLEFLSSFNPKPKIILGGPHVTIMPQMSLNLKGVDAVVIGEGEETFKELIKKGSFENVNGLWYKVGNAIVRNNLREPIKDLDKLPFPAWDLLPLKDYFTYWFQLDSVGGDLKGINIITSRGCPYNCSYCQPTLSKMFGKKIRRRSVDNVIDELLVLKKIYNINSFMIQDDTFNFDNSWVENFCNAMIDKKVNLIWGCNTRANLIDKRLFKLMKQAGLRKVNVGIESGSQRVLDEIYKKGITLKQVRDGTKVLHELNLKTQGYFMIGAPGETKEEIDKTISFARELDIDEATFSVTTPLPCTYLYDMTKELISINIENFDYYKNYPYTSLYSQREINYYKRKAFLLFYLSRKHIGYTLKQFLSYKAFKKSLAKLKRF